MESPEDLDQIGKLVVGVESAGIGQDPKRGGLQPLRLKPEACTRPVEGEAVRADADHRYASGPKARHLPRKRLAPGPELVSGELGGRDGRAGDQVGDSDTLAQQEPLLPGLEQPAGEAGGVERRPEAVARSGEVVAGGRGVEPGVDAAEEDPEIGRDQIGHPPVDCSGELGLRRPIAGEALAGIQRELTRTT
jgi:hypothetical protein